MAWYEEKRTYNASRSPSRWWGKEGKDICESTKDDENGNVVIKRHSPFRIWVFEVEECVYSIGVYALLYNDAVDVLRKRNLTPTKCFGKTTCCDPHYAHVWYDYLLRSDKEDEVFIADTRRNGKRVSCLEGRYRLINEAFHS